VDRDNPADTCAGDSGSGLVVNVAAAQPFLAGITSWGEKADCGARSFSGVYTRVANYDDWILSYTDPSAYAKRQKERQQVVTSSSSGGGGGSFSVEALIGMIGLLLLRRKMVK
jgi:secreted trypsin-like serine protease